MTLATGWRIDVDRGPAWLFLKVHPPDEIFTDESDFAESVWDMASAHFVYRIVLEMEAISLLPSRMIGQLVLLQKRLQKQGGVLRLSGLNDECQRVLRTCRLDDNLKSFPDRECAVKAFMPSNASYGIRCARPPSPGAFPRRLDPIHFQVIVDAAHAVDATNGLLRHLLLEVTAHLATQGDVPFVGFDMHRPRRNERAGPQGRFDELM
jgi:anti-anti-sigma factor